MKSFLKFLINLVSYGILICVIGYFLLILLFRNGGCNSSPPNKYEIVKGVVNISIPDTMKVGVDSTITISIKMGSPIELKEKYFPSNVETFTSQLMEANIIDPSGEKFKITPLFIHKEQVIDSSLPTIWQWNVQPLESGEGRLVVILSPKVSNGIENSYRDFNVKEKDIYLKASFIKKIMDFIKHYWQWIISIIVLPFILWLRGYIIKKINAPKKRDKIGFIQ